MSATQSWPKWVGLSFGVVLIRLLLKLFWGKRRTAYPELGLITWQTIFLKETENAAILPTFRWSTHIRTFVFQKIPIQKRHCSIVATFTYTIPCKISLILSASAIRMPADAIRISANSLIVSADSLIQRSCADRSRTDRFICRWFSRNSRGYKTAKILYGDILPLVLSPRKDTNKANEHEFSS